ncbi:MAG: beta-propeller fold lactonase family protein [Fuerstiella sp.]|nr:beta-propeller fold lactonase family protein [Fuerstiella sp.]MCP4859516.1 beta-propeller fold lactonase family protein [Fuerstiella sp.]
MITKHRFVACRCLLLMLVVASLGTASADQVDRSPLQLAVSADGKWLYTANRTANSVSRIDVAARKVVAEIPVDAGPSGIAVSPDGNIVYTVNRLADTLSVIDVVTSKVASSVSLANQPYDVVVGPDGTIYVACLGKDNVVQVIDGKSLSITNTIAVDQNPRHLLLSDDGKRLLVTCDAYDTTRWLDVIVLATGKVEHRVPLKMTSNLRGVAQVEPNVALVVHLNPNPFAPLTQVQQGWVNTNAISFVYFDGPKPRHVTLLLDEFTRYYANPYDVAVTPDRKFAYISCGGAEQVVVIDLRKALALIESTPAERRGQMRSRLTLSARFIAARIPVGQNPYGLAMSTDGKQVFLANHLGNSVSIIDTATNQVSATIEVGSAEKMASLRRGEILFHTASICFQRQFSCASCHPDGHTTGLSWDLEDDGLGNPKNIRSFRGVKGTAPFRWQGEAPLIGADECGPTVSGAMRGSELDEADLAALTEFVTNMPLLPNPHRGSKGEISAAASRGRAIFGGDALCTECHTPGVFSNGERLSVGLGRGRPDKLKMPNGDTVDPTEFDVPHLLGVWDSAPYLHDGRAKTLLEIFQKHNPDDEHGTTSDLSEAQLNDLVEYLKTL